MLINKSLKRNLKKFGIDQGITGGLEVPRWGFGESTALDDNSASALDGHSEQVQYNHRRLSTSTKQST
jgi:hypothetical protein